MRYSTLLTIVGFEKDFIKEFLDYHFGMGIEHAVLIIDLNPPDILNVITEPYVQKGLVTRVYTKDFVEYRNIKWPDRQKLITKKVAHSLVGTTEWLAIVDCDEFIYPRKHDDIPTWLETWERAESLVLNWKIFGFGDRIFNPKSLIHEHLYCSYDYWMGNSEVNSISKPHCIDFEKEDLWINHAVHTLHPELRLNNYGEPCPNFYSLDAPKYGDADVHHYMLRSMEDIAIKKLAYNGEGRYDMKFVERFNRCDEYNDEICKRFGHLVEH